MSLEASRIGGSMGPGLEAAWAVAGRRDRSVAPDARFTP